MALSTCFASTACHAGSKGWVVASQVRSQPTTRRSANYQPSSWDYDSLQSLRGGDLNGTHTTHLEKLKENTRHLLSKEAEPVARLKLVDVLQRLGVGYHFEEEIKDALGSMPIERANTLFKDDIHSMSLLFRLLREHGFPVSPDIFSSLKEENGNFKASLLRDTQALLSLHEASYLAFEGETLLDEARIFTTKYLSDLKLQMDPHLKGKVSLSLDLPLHWRTPRLEARWHIDQYERDGNMDHMLLQFAKVDFNTVQSIHQSEIRKLTRWWKDVGLGDKLSFARDRLIEYFFFATGIVFEPHLGYCREELTKAFALVAIIDDFYDIYGTPEELNLFTNAVQRWDSNAMEGFPEYMKILYSALYNTTNEVADHIHREEGWDALPYLRKAAELERGDTPTSIQCYMQDNGVSEAVARNGIQDLIINSWKKLNKEAVDCHPLPRYIANAAINLGRISHCTYHKGDGLGAPDQEKKNMIKSLFFDPVALKGGQDSLGLLDDRFVVSNV
ncbi:alpha-terpineol synthase, chloroplastic-like isoform X2 [Phoenix dactylifera]|uniref:Alpha-terpineol synthase, chloroplastic-like isoform X2 n=1 Tax=Phoenix dactylifera TaxID=42345 RepID=A0A8B9AWK3_PHODC|nr:alpha-terpineol synthase, chloroplastic-like isoform X2 [Phoenix dactylifera]